MRTCARRETRGATQTPSDSLTNSGLLDGNVRVDAHVCKKGGQEEQLKRLPTLSPTRVCWMATSESMRTCARRETKEEQLKRLPTLSPTRVCWMATSESMRTCCARREPRRATQTPSDSLTNSGLLDGNVRVDAHVCKKGDKRSNSNAFRLSHQLGFAGWQRPSRCARAVQEGSQEEQLKRLPTLSPTRVCWMATSESMRTCCARREPRRATQMPSDSLTNSGLLDGNVRVDAHVLCKKGAKKSNSNAFRLSHQLGFAGWQRPSRCARAVQEGSQEEQLKRLPTLSPTRVCWMATSESMRTCTRRETRGATQTPSDSLADSGLLNGTVGVDVLYVCDRTKESVLAID